MFRDYAEEKRHDEWKTGNHGQGWEDDEEEDEDEGIDWDDEIDENFETLETEREK